MAKAKAAATTAKEIGNQREGERGVSRARVRVAVVLRKRRVCWFWVLLRFRRSQVSAHHYAFLGDGRGRVQFRRPLTRISHCPFPSAEQRLHDSPSTTAKIRPNNSEGPFFLFFFLPSDLAQGDGCESRRHIQPASRRATIIHSSAHKSPTTLPLTLYITGETRERNI